MKNGWMLIAWLLTSAVAFAVTRPAPHTRVDRAIQDATVAFEARDYDTALRKLNQAEPSAASQPQTLALRGAILVRKGDLDNAAIFLRKALEGNAKLWQARFSLAEIAFLQGDYAGSRAQFETLLPLKAPNPKSDPQLVRYRIFLNLVLEQKEPPAQGILGTFQAVGDSPAYYFARAALGFAHGDARGAKDWVRSACKIYPEAANEPFAIPMAELGWIQFPLADFLKASVAGGPASESAAQPRNEPAVSPSPVPRIAPVRPPAAGTRRDAATQTASASAPSSNLKALLISLGISALVGVVGLAVWAICLFVSAARLSRRVSRPADFPDAAHRARTTPVAATAAIVRHEPVFDKLEVVPATGPETTAVVLGGLAEIAPAGADSHPGMPVVEPARTHLDPVLAAAPPMEPESPVLPIDDLAGVKEPVFAATGGLEEAPLVAAPQITAGPEIIQSAVRSVSPAQAPVSLQTEPPGFFPGIDPAWNGPPSPEAVLLPPVGIGDIAAANVTSEAFLLGTFERSSVPERVEIPEAIQDRIVSTPRPTHGNPEQECLQLASELAEQLKALASVRRRFEIRLNDLEGALAAVPDARRHIMEPLTR